MDALIANMDFFLRGLRTTILMTVVAYSGALILGVVLASLKEVRLRPVSFVAGAMINSVRSTPLLMFIFWFFYLIPAITGRATSPLTAGILALAVFYSSYLAIIIGAGIRSVSRGQVTAAHASGLSHPSVMRFIVLPQALRNMVPALMTQFVSLFLSTSLTYVIGVREFFRSANIVNNREFESFAIFTFVALTYLTIATSLSRLSRRLEVPSWKKSISIRQASESPKAA